MRQCPRSRKEHQVSVHLGLYYREKLLGFDVREALERIVTKDGKTLPLAITKGEVVDQLMIMSSVDKDGHHHPRNARDQKSGAERFATDLQTTSVFMAGVELYAEATKRPAIPTADYFFNHVYCNGDTRACLNAMSETEIANSLPRRTALPQALGPDNKKVPVHQAPRADGQLIQTVASGRIAGVVIFSAGEAETGLVAAWYARRANVTYGSIDKLVDLVERIVGEDDERIANLRRHGEAFKSTAKIARERATERPGNIWAQLRA
jgi:hypothetical protein